MFTVRRLSRSSVSVPRADLSYVERVQTGDDSWRQGDGLDVGVPRTGQSPKSHQ